MNNSYVKLGLALWLALPAAALADSGFYIGGSVGGAPGLLLEGPHGGPKKRHCSR